MIDKRHSKGKARGKARGIARVIRDGRESEYERKDRSKKIGERNSNVLVKKS